MGRGNVGRSLKFSVKNPVAATQRDKGGAGGKSYSRRKINVEERNGMRQEIDREHGTSDLIGPWRILTSYLVTRCLINLVFILEA